jgi:phage shock protein E
MKFHVISAAVMGLALAAFVAPVPAMAQTAPAAQAQAVPLISVAELKSLMRSKKHFVLIDVRQPDEYAAGHIDGAVLMPLDKLPQTYRQIPKGGKLVVNCRSGHRSAEAVTFLLAHGYKNIFSLDGGYLAWTAAK